MPSEFVFRISPMDATTLMPQVSCALELHNEQVSRCRCPRLWKLVDRLRGVPKAPAEVRRKRRRRRTVLAAIDLILGAFLLIVGLSEPDKLYIALFYSILAATYGTVVLWNNQRTLLAILSMLGGLFWCIIAYGNPAAFGHLLPLGIGAVILSIVCLFTRKRRQVTAYDRAAKRLVTRKYDAQALKQMHFTISDQGVTLGMPENSAEPYTVPLAHLAYMIETEDLLVPVYAGSVTVLQKRDLVTGTLPDLREFLGDRILQTSL